VRAKSASPKAEGRIARKPSWFAAAAAIQDWPRIHRKLRLTEPRADKGLVVARAVSARDARFLTNSNQFEVVLSGLNQKNIAQGAPGMESVL
jgi:hypothetical protein